MRVEKLRSHEVLSRASFPIDRQKKLFALSSLASAKSAQNAARASSALLPVHLLWPSHAALPA